MLRTAVATVLAAMVAVPAVALAPSAAAAPSTTLFASVQTASDKGETITLEEGTESAGVLAITSCANTSPTAFVCKGTGTVMELGPGKVTIRWKCPAGKGCARKAEGTLKKHGNTLALLHVKASVQTFERRGSTFGIAVELVGE